MQLLSEKNYNKVQSALKEVTINNLFARSVVEHKVKGSVFVDRLDEPEIFYIIHPYGMSLLLGHCDNTEFNTLFREYALNTNKHRTGHEWMQVFPNTWDSVLKSLFEDCIITSADNVNKIESGIIELNTRVNFKFNPNKYNSLKKQIFTSDYKIVRTDKDMFTAMKGTVVPSAFWDSADDFIENGIGFSLFHENQLASTAYSAFAFDRMLEIGIETKKEYRGKGIAKAVCSVFIDFCNENNFEPIWSCSLENSGSNKLALSLGFEPVLTTPYYRLSK